MAQGRGNANRALVMVLAILCVLAITQPALATMYNVGGAGGWTYNAVGWGKGQRFKAGDVLVFKYKRGAHNVVPVSAANYKTCTSSRGARVYTSGKDMLKLKRGNNYFICSFRGHCQSNMKIAVKAM